MADLHERLRALEAQCAGQARELRALEKIERLQQRIRVLERERAVLEARAGELHAVLSLSRSLSRIEPTADLPQAVLPLLARACRGDAVALWRSQPAGGRLARVAALGADRSATPELRWGEGIVGLAAAVGQALLVPDVAAEARIHPAELLAGPAGAYLAVPCRAPWPGQSGACIGVLAVQCARPPGFQMADLDRAHALAEPLALAWRLRMLDGAEEALPPRGILEEAVHREAARGRRYRRPFAVLRLDLEPGPTRDQLPRLDAILRGEIRRADLLAHLGGAAFGLLLPETEPAAADAVARKLRVAVAAAGPGELTVGYACCPAAAAEGDALLELAEDALLQAKAKGGRCVCGTPAAEECPAPGG